jgi:ABC-type cobalt transport system substrate-binding protein
MLTVKKNDSDLKTFLLALILLMVYYIVQNLVHFDGQDLEWVNEINSLTPECDFRFPLQSVFPGKSGSVR